MALSEKSRWFDTPKTGLGYAGRFYMRVFQSVKSAETLNVDADIAPMKTRWFLSQKDHAKWLSLMRYSIDKPKQAFTFSAPAGVWALMQVLEELSISFSRVMHMSSKLTLLDRDGFEAEQHYTTFVHYRGLVRHSDHAVLMRFESIIRDVHGHERMRLVDEMYVSGLEASLINHLPEPQKDREPRQKTSLLTQNKAADSVTLTIKRGMGQRYGRLSGDLNPLHISSIGARLFGHKSSFIQGLCTLNLTLASLGNVSNSQIRELDIQFIKPVLQPSKPKLLYSLTEFELVSEQDDLLAHGHYTL